MAESPILFFFSLSLSLSLSKPLSLFSSLTLSLSLLARYAPLGPWKKTKQKTFRPSFSG